MEQTYLNCQHGLKPQCPEIANEIMQKFIAFSPSDFFNDQDIKAVDNLCGACISFTPKE